MCFPVSLAQRESSVEFPNAPEQWRTLGPVPRGGSGDTVGNALYDSEFRQTRGSIFRKVADVGNWDASEFMNVPGQSGDPRSPHYADHFDPWISGQGLPLTYSRGAVEQSTEMKITLSPGTSEP